MYFTEVTKVGDLVQEMLENDDMLILFNESAPRDLHEVSVLHNNKNSNFEIKSGGKILIDGISYDIIDVGEKAKETLKTLGHFTIRFTNDKKVNLPGEVILFGEKPSKIYVGMTIEIN